MLGRVGATEESHTMFMQEGPGMQAKEAFRPVKLSGSADVPPLISIVNYGVIEIIDYRFRCLLP